METSVRSGTTTIGMKCKDGVILASESKAGMGYMVTNKEVQKVFQIDDRIGVTIAGLVSDAQQLVNIIKAEINLYKLECEEEMRVDAVASLLSNIMYARRLFPYFTQIVVGGMDKEGSKLFSFDPTGSKIEEEYVSTGSGSPFVYGILEKDFKKGMTIEEGKGLVKQAIKSAAERDMASGGEKIWIAEITSKGFKLSEEKIK